MKIAAQARESMVADAAAGGVPRGGAAMRARVENQARMHGVSPRTVYRLLKRHEAKRPRTGVRTVEISEEKVDMYAALIAQADLAAGHALEVVGANAAGPLPSATNMRLRVKEAAGLTRKTVETTKSRVKVRSKEGIELRAARSNRVWQLDFTVSAQYYIGAAGCFCEYDMLADSKNKPEKDSRTSGGGATRWRWCRAGWSGGRTPSRRWRRRRATSTRA